MSANWQGIPKDIEREHPGDRKAQIRALLDRLEEEKRRRFLSAPNPQEEQQNG
jgi:hypothetical protein